MSHKFSTQVYYDIFFGRTKCVECGGLTGFLDLNRGYRGFCTVTCLNRHKAKSPEFLELLSSSQRGIPRKKHSEESRKLIAQRSREMWASNREKMLAIFRDPAFRQRASQKAAESASPKMITKIDGIRCESKAEIAFVKKCLAEKIRIKRYADYDGSRSIHIGNRWVVPDFILDEVVVEVKDFHHWFRRELFAGLPRYRATAEWCYKQGLFFVFWFQQIGYVHIEWLYGIKNDDGIKEFIRKHKGTQV